MRRARCAIAGAALALLAAPAGARDDLRPQQLYDAAGGPRFTLYLACRGPREFDSEQCYTVASAVREWCARRQVFRRTLDAAGSVKKLDRIDPARIARDEPALPLRLLLRFEPLLEPSRWNEFQGMGRYDPPKAGFRAWVDVFDVASGTRIAGFSDYHKEATPQHADATPFIQADIERLLRRLEPEGR
jgi:hypothetical protein